MNKKILKSGLTIGSFAAFAAPIATIVSCGGLSAEDYSKDVLIKTSWAANGPQYKTLVKIVDEYNRTKPKTAAKVIVKNAGTGYGSIVKSELTDIRMRNMNNVANLVIDYPDVLGQLNRYNVKLDFASSDSVGSGNTINRNIFDTNFLAKNIEGSTSTSSLFAAPVASSTEMLTINRPVLKYLIEKITASGTGVTKSSTADDIVKINKILEVSDGDKTEIAKIWTAPSAADISTAFADTSTGPAITTIDDSILKDWTKLINFATKIQKAFFPNPADNDNYVLGIDSPSNSVYQAIAELGGVYSNPSNTDWSKFPFKIGADGKAVYNFVQDNDPSIKTIKDSLKIFENGVKSRGLKFQSGGAYTSGDLKNHHAVFSLGSTAGYTYNYEGDGTERILYKGETAKYAYKLVATTKTNAIAEYTRNGYTNYVYSETNKSSAGSHDKVVNNDAASVITAAITSASGFALLTSDERVAADASQPGSNIKKAYEYTSKSGKKYEYYVVPNGPDVTLGGGNDPKTLDKTEALSTLAPTGFTASSSTKKSYMIQGPSFVGIKHGTDIDHSVGKFVKWFFNKNSKIEYDGSEVSIVDYFETNAKYITPLDGAFTNPTSDWKEGNGITYKTFHEVATEANIVGFQSPVTGFSSQIRKDVFDPNIAAWSNSYHEKNTGKSIDDIYNGFLETASSISGIK